MPFFSIVIPVHNVAAYLSSCIDSILCQQYFDIEIILIDDCSSDGSSEICDWYAKKHSYIRSIHFDSNRGVAAARNHGVMLSKGEYIIFIDSDDRLFKGSLKGVRNSIKSEKGEDLVVCRYISENGILSNSALFENAVVNSKTVETLLSHITKIDYHLDHCWHYVLSRSFTQRNKIHFNDVIVAEDSEYITHALALANSITFYAGEFYWYREREGSLKNSYGIQQTAAFLKIAYAMCKFLENTCLSDARHGFIKSQARHAIGLFSARLSIHSAEEIQMFSSAIINDELLLTASLFPLATVSKLLKTQEDVTSILTSYKDALVNDTFSLVKAFESLSVYIYCAGPIGEAVMTTLLEKGCSIKNVIDDNASLSGRKLLDRDISTASIFATMSKDDLHNSVVIVCNQKKHVFDAICNNLMSIGIAKERIVHGKF